VVCDGMGGGPAGEVASELAAASILDHLDRSAKPAPAVIPDAGGYLPQTSRLAEAVRRSNQFVYSQALRNPDQTDMGTTVVTAWVTRHIASVAHVGDSRAYLWHQGRLEALTRDHSLVEAQVRAGLVNREDALRSGHRNVLVRVLGRQPNVDVDLAEVPVQPGDYLVLCSDGLTRMVSDQMLAETIAELRDPQRICDHLIGAANRNGGADNITVVVVQVALTWWRRLSNRWSGQV